MRRLLGELDPPSSTVNGKIDGAENPTRLPFLLWSAGPNGSFGLDLSLRGTLKQEDIAKRPLASDDIANFLP